MGSSRKSQPLTAVFVIFILAASALLETSPCEAQQFDTKTLAPEELFHYLCLTEYCRGFLPAYDESYQQTIHVTKGAENIPALMSEYSKQKAYLEAEHLKPLKSQDYQRVCLDSFTTGIWAGYLKANVRGEQALQNGLTTEGYAFVRKSDYVSAASQVGIDLKLPPGAIENFTNAPIEQASFNASVTAKRKP